MSGGQREGSGGKAVLSGEKATSSCSSYRGSELQFVEISLPSTRVGPTIDSVAASAPRRALQGKVGESGKNQSNHSHQQQLKYYGRRKRGNEQVALRQIVDRGHTDRRETVEEASLDGGGGCLALDLTSEPETRLDEGSEFTLDSRDGRSSGGLSPGSVPYSLPQGSMQSHDIAAMEQQEVGLSSVRKNDEGANAIVEHRKSGGEVKEKTEYTVSSGVQDLEDRRPNGLVVDLKIPSEVPNNERGHPSRLSSEQDGLDVRWLGFKDIVISSEGTNAAHSPQQRSIHRKDGLGGSLVSRADHATVDVKEQAGKGRKRDRSFVDSDPSDTIRLKGLLETPIRRSTTAIAKILGAARNGDMDRKRKKSSGTSSSRFRKARAQGEDSRAEQDALEVFEDPGTLAHRKMELRKRLELERQQHEESVLAKAEEICSKQEIFDSSKKIPLKGKEPARCKTHWDFVLEEMVWLSKDFEKERKWKLSQAKRVAVRVSRSKLDVEAKGLRRIKEEEQRTRRVASNIAKDVKKFWMKVEKLVMYKHQLNLEERRKKALDKHLDFLLGQTERYSTMLAENLADNIASPVPKALPSAPQEGAIVGDDIDFIPPEQAGSLEESAPGQTPVEGETDVGDEDFDMDKEEEEEDDETTIAADEALITEVEKKEELDMLQRESELPLEELLKLYTANRGAENLDVADESTDNNSEGSDDDEREEQVAWPSEVPVRSTSDGGGDEDFDMDKEIEEEDDETTIAADEALITEDEKKEELNMLQRESELPLEELLKFYRRNGENLDVAEDSAGHDSEFSYEDSTDDSDAEDEIDNSDHEKVEEEVILGKEEGADLVQENATSTVKSSSTSAELTGVVENGTLETIRQQAVAGSPQASSHDNVATDMPMKDSLELIKGAGLADMGSQRGSRCAGEVVPVEALLQRSQDLIDDGEYLPATSTEGVEEDDETTLEEEERLAAAEDDDPAAEVDRLKRENEMSIEELLDQYKSMAAADDDTEYSDEFELSDEDEEDFMEDRQDRTSEAGTSGTDEELAEDFSGGDIARNRSEAMDRVGEPSTSGREEWSLVSSGYGRKLKKANDRSNLFESNGNSCSGEKTFLLKSKHLSSDVVGANNGLRRESDNGARISSLLLEGDDRLDEDAVAVVARVSEAAKRRGERAQKRSQREQEKASILPSAVEQDGLYESSDGMSHEIGNTSPSRQDTVQYVSEVSLANGKSSVGGHEVDGSQSRDLPLQMQGPVKSVVRTVGSGVDGIIDTEDGKTSQDKLADAAAEAQSAQPTGYTFLTTKVRTKLPFLLKHSLREYQHIGLDWLVTMYEKRLNGILADEMGLGKTIMTISLLAHLACDRGIWGPHLIVVPTSVMLNWETEFMKWCPAFKILTYFGNAKERKVKRQGWSKQNSFHVCITTYRLVIQDAKAFRRKKWKYLILDEAHLIKNWKSQRWQTLLNFNSKRRILLTGTPLQNDLMELWSLMHFLMPHVFQSHQEFRDWFSNPITGMVEGQEQINKEVVDRLHNVLRPFLLRRLKQDVEKQLPGKFEHVIRCRLSKRQRNLYEDFMANSDTQATLASGNFLGLINVLMQLRKVCNHPDLFEGRPIMSAFDMSGLVLHLSSLACSTLHLGPFSAVNLRNLNLLLSELSSEMTAWESEEVADIRTSAAMIEELSSTGEDSWESQGGSKQTDQGQGLIEELQATLKAKREKEKKDKVSALARLSLLRCQKKPVYGSDLRKCVLVEHPVHDVHKIEGNRCRYFEYSSVIAEMVQLPLTRLANVLDLVESFVFAIPAARAPPPTAWCSHPISSSNILLPTFTGEVLEKVGMSLEPLRPVVVRRQLFFPDRRLLQFDCGKLQELAILLRRLKSEGHRALIFTQMAKMLDVLEGFISLYGYTYMRLDGSTKPEQRQILMQRFNTNPKIFLFILSTRSGGVGINLVGADTVIFYDSDWNPAMDQQAQDRCHRIGQTREVHIYRLVSESTIEENILKKANQKRALDDLVIQSGSYNTEFFKRLDPMELFSGLRGVKSGGGGKVPGIMPSTLSTTAEAIDHELSSAEVEAALKNAEDEADYMAMKRVEQEEAAEYQEFMEEVLPGNPDEEDLADELEEGKSTLAKAPADGGVVGMPKDDIADGSNKGPTAEEIPQTSTSLITADAEEEMDMLADVKQMAAAAAAAGRGSISFEDQLRPVERYAMRFLELWDPRVDRASEAAQVLFEEKEWELDQLEKLKEEQEAEIDEDNEPLLYESWDTAFANEAYRQQVEVLAQQQENQRQLEWEAMEEEMRDADRAVVEASSAVIGAENFKLKSNLKKFKKTKFKSLKKGSLGSDEQNSASGERDVSYRDPQFDVSSVPPRSPSLRKRKAPRLLEEEFSVEEYAKRLKKEHLGNKSSEFDQWVEASDDDTWPEDADIDSGDAQFKSPTSSGAKKSVGEKILIMSWPLKKAPIITLERERKKDAAKMQEHVDPWVSAEDAILCAVVHEYGGNWQLASDALAGIPDGSIYRGCHRHPFHCRERFRQLLAQYASASCGDLGNDRHMPNSSTNAHVKVTEEHTKRLLEVVLQLPENELLLQRHFGALLTAVRNMIARRKAGIEKPVFSGKGIISPQGGDFVSLSKLTKLSSSHQQPIPQKAASLKSSSDVQQSVAKALKDVEEADEFRSSIVKDSLLLQPGNVADKEFHLEDDKFDVLELLKLDAVSGSPSNESGDLSLSKYKAVSVSVEDLLGLKPSTAPVPPSALRNYAESNADQRFRTAMESGWGSGLYEWAAAALSGLGTLSMPRGKTKKRPPPTDSNKPPKPKQSRMSNARKKGPDDKNAPTSPQPSSKKKKKSPVASSEQPPKDARKPESSVNGAVVSDKKDNLASDEQISKDVTDETQETTEVGETAAVIKDVQLATPAIKSSKGKSLKPKKRPSSPASLSKGAKSKSSPHIFRDFNLGGGESGRLGQKISPSGDAGASALHDLNSRTDDVVVTRVSIAPDVVSEISPQFVPEGEKLRQRELVAGVLGINHKQRCGEATAVRVYSNIGTDTSSGLADLRPKVDGEITGTPPSARVQVNAGATPDAEKASGTLKSRKGDTWVPPAEMLAPVGPFSSLPSCPDSVRKLLADVSRRAPNSGDSPVLPLDTWALESNSGGISGLSPTTGRFPVVGADPNVYHLDSYDSSMKTGISRVLVQEESQIEPSQMSSLHEIDRGQEAFPSPALAKTVRPRSSDLDTLQHRRLNLGASPDQAREQRAPAGVRPALRSTSPHQRPIQ